MSQSPAKYIPSYTPRALRHAAIFGVLNPEDLVVIGKLLEDLNRPVEHIQMVYKMFLSTLKQQKKQLPRWEDTPIETKLLCYSAVMNRSQRQAYAFTLNFGDAVIKRALATSKITNTERKTQSLTSILAKRLKKKFHDNTGFIPPFWFTIEIVLKSKKPHIHGMFLAYEEELEAIRNGLEAAGTGYRQRWDNKTLNAEKRFGRTRWEGYSTEDRDITQWYLDTHNIKLGNLYSRTRDLGKQGREVYEQLRDIVNKAVSLRLE
jgi:hypothetical protein